MQAASTMCDTTFDLQGWEIGVGSLLAALGSVEFLNEITTFTMLAQAELNCNSLSDPQARAMQLAQFETFVEQTAAKDRSAVLMGDFNIVGSRVTNTTAHVADPEYVTALAALHLGDPTVPTNDQISMLPPGLDLQEADTLRDEPAMATFLTDEPVKCVGTSIGFTPIATTSACTLAGDVDVPDRIDYIFVRPPQLPAVATTDPRWIVETQLPGTDHTLTDVWNSPFPTKDGSSQDVDHGRLSDHKPVVSALEFARLSNPPKYHPLWHHTVEQRVTGVNASMFDDCWLCGEVDPFAHMDQQILPSTGPSNWSNPNTTECTDISAPQFGVDACIDDWANTLPHTPPNETAIVMHDYVMDQDNTSSNDILQQGNWATFRYADGMYELDQMDSGNRTVSGMALETEEGTVGLCTKDFATVCQQITLTPVPLGQ
jgi:hypothetical protein